MQIGRVSKIFNERGFGFIQNEKYPEGIFFHISKMVDKEQFNSLKPGTSVIFNVENGSKPNAIDVELYKEY